MLSQFSNRDLSFGYLHSNDEELVITALEQVKTHQGRISKMAVEHFYQVLQVLVEWKMPARVIWAALAYYFPEYNLPLSHEPLSFLRAKILKMIYDFGVLYHPPDSTGDSEHLRKAHRVNRLRQLFIRAYTDLEFVLFCLADHLVRMNSIELLDYREARLLAEDNEDIFLPLVEMLGAWQLRRDLGDLSLKKLNPKKAWDKIRHCQNSVKEEHKQCYKSIKEILTAELNRLGIEGDICFHFSPASSIYRRILRGEALEKLMRKVKIDIVVASEEACYQVLGLIHRKYSPMAGRTSAGSYFRELIASPKFNGYRALITTVGYRRLDDPKQEKLVPIEFRIYTQEMEKTNSYGIIWVKFLSDTPITIKNAWWEQKQVIEFVGAHPLDTVTKEIAVFSPTGEVYQLPQGSTPIDYAYRVHSDIGNHCKRLWVNGRPANYAQKLHNGDLVEIEVDARYPGPDAKWERVVQTSTAKKHIKRALKQHQITHKGREIIDKILTREVVAYSLPEISTEKVDKFLEYTARYFNYSDLAALYFDLANPKQSSHSTKPSANRIVARLIAAQLADHIVKANGEAIGISKDRIKFAQCQHDKKPCRVTPGSEIVGRILRPGTEHEQWVIYRRDCPRAPQDETGILLAWLGNRRSGEPVRVNIQAVDRGWLLDEVLHHVYDLYEDGLYLLGVQAKVSRDRSARIQMTIDAPSYQPVERLDEKFRQLRVSGKIDGFFIDALSPIDKMLLVEPDSLPNPYTPGLARDQRIFKGRTEEIEKIISCLSGNQNFVVLYGINRVGKSSLLHYLNDYVVEEYNLVPVIIDMLGLEERSETRFWLQIATKINETIGHLYKGKKGPTKSIEGRIRRNAFGGFREWLEEAKAAIRGRKWLIMIDELNQVDELWEPSEAQSVIYRLRSLVENHPDVAFIFCVQETLYKEAASSKGKVVSWPLLRAGVPLRLDYLDRQAAEKLIREPMGKMMQFDEKVVEEMIYLTACHPYHLQNMLHRVVSRVGLGKRNFETIRVSAVDLEAIIPQLLDDGQQLFYDFLQEYHGFARMAVLSALAYVSQSDYPGATITKLEDALKQRGVKVLQTRLIQTLEQLRDAGVVIRREESGHTKYFIRVPLFGKWLLENRPYHLITS